jgi:hypothetical protein
MKEAHRAYIYRVATALVPLTVFYGLLADNEASLWLGVAGAALSIGGNALATANTSTKPPGDDPEWDRYPGPIGG